MISVIIVTWNSEAHISSCLESVKEQTEKDLELIIVDNNSNDATKEIIRSFKIDMIIENRENSGFAFANNQGIRASRGEYVFTLNPDVILNPGYLRKVKDRMNEDERSGMISGLLIRPQGEIDSQGIYLDNIRRFYDIGAARQRRAIKGKKLIGPCAAAGFYRRKMLEDVKIAGEYFDEDFFAYVEDVDLAWRGNKAGWNAAYCPEAMAVHIRGGSGVNSKWVQYLSFRNRCLMIIKNEDLRHFIKYSYLYVLYDIARFIYLIVTNRFVLHNNHNNLNHIKRAWEKRKMIRKN